MNKEEMKWLEERFKDVESQLNDIDRVARYNILIILLLLAILLKCY